ncbi:MAG TPA: corrinoid protein [Anaerolineales bacterium]|nr:corrinoid protein [Anaerolineales bacterium]
MNATLSGIYDAILDGDVPGTQDRVQAAIAADLKPGDILSEGMVAAMREVGRRFEEGDYYVPEMLVAARAMQAGLSLLRPCLVAGDVQSAGKVAIGTVKGDLHDIGKNLVKLMLEGAGFEVQDLGVDVAPEKFVEAISAGDVDIVAVSALLTTTMPHMKTTIEAIEQAGLRDKVKIIVGGAPLTQGYATEIGADGFSADASSAPVLVESLLQAMTDRAPKSQ